MLLKRMLDFPAMPPFYIDDLQVGMRFRSSDVTVTASDIIAFAQQFDPQPFHTDESAAQKSIFGGLVASGWHTAALTMRLLVQNLPLAGGLIGRGGECEWPAPVRPDDNLHIEGEIIALRDSKTQADRGRVSARVTTLNQHGQAVQIMTAHIVALRRRGG